MSRDTLVNPSPPPPLVCYLVTLSQPPAPLECDVLFERSLLSIFKSFFFK